MKRKKASLVFVTVIISLILISSVAQALSWSNPVKMGWGGEWDTDPEAAADTNGNVYVVWSTYPWYRGLFFSKFNGTEWSPKMSIGNSNNFNPDITVDQSNNVHVVWQGSGYYMYHRQYDGSTWSNAVSTGLQGGYPTVAVTPSGEIFVANTGPSLSGNPILYVHGDGINWSTPASLGISSRPDLSVDHNGVVYLAYVISGKPVFRTWLGTAWSEEFILDGSCGKPLEMFHSNTGNSDIVCSNGNHWHKDETGWHGPVNIAPSITWAGDAADRSDGTIIFSYGYDNPEEIYTRLWTGSVWLPPENVSNTQTRSIWPTVALSSNNYAFTIWSENKDGGFPFVLFASQAQLPMQVSIDIKPGDEPNCINSNSRGVIPVGIISSSNFDATSVDPLSVNLDGQGIRILGNGKIQAYIEDIDGDELDDLIVQIEDSGDIYQEGDSTGVLIGETFDGIAFMGTDTICIVP